MFRQPAPKVFRSHGFPAGDYRTSSFLADASKISLESGRYHFGKARKRGIDMATLQDLLDRKAALEKEIAVTRRHERADAISKVKSLMTEYGLTMADLSARAPSKAAAGKGGKVAAKYRNAATGDTWSGRGLQPKWLKAALAAGRKIDEFAVK